MATFAERLCQALDPKAKLNLDVVYARILAGKATKEERAWFAGLCAEYRAEQEKRPNKPR